MPHNMYIMYIQNYLLDFASMILMQCLNMPINYIFYLSVNSSDFSTQLGPGLLCQHNFEHNRSLKALSIMLA